jgi:prolyl 4-hydroxylase
MSTLTKAGQLFAAGKQAEAIECVRSAAGAGDGEALYALANWALFGLHGPRDLPAAHRFLKQAAARGYVAAERLRAVLVGNGTGCARDPDKASEMLEAIRSADPDADQQLSFSKTMRSEAEVADLPIEILSEGPSIRCIRSLLTEDECGYVVARAQPHLQPSSVIDPRTGRRMPHPFRTSTGMSFGPTLEDYVIHKLNRRIALVTGTEVGWGEPLHVLNYAPGQEYRPHIDALPGVTNQRHWTVLVYLNNVYEGGATRFEMTGLEFAGEVGDALIFRNVDDAGRPDLNTQHTGLPVTSGTKWLATRWIRQADYHPWMA